MRLAFIAIAGCLVLQAVLALVVIPPWQNPDEPQHLMSVRQVLTYGADYRYDVLDPRAERTILASMAEHRWWEHYGRPAPATPPTSFADGPARVVSAYFGPPDGGSRVYYRLMAALLRTARIDEILPQLYTMRAASVILTLLALACVWQGARAIDPLTAMVVTALMSLHPQFVLVAASASPDAAVNFAGAFVWFQAVVLLQAQAMRIRELIGLWAGAIAAFLLRRVGAPLLLVSLGVTAVAVASGGSGSRRRSLLLVATASALMLIAGIAVVSLTAEGTRAFQWIVRNPISVTSIAGSDLSSLPRFLSGLFRSFWLTAGWLRYGPPNWWLGMTIAVTAVAVGGLARLRQSASRRVVAMSIAMLAVQLLAVIGLYFFVLTTGAHGRYLFPVLPGVLFLVWAGWRAWFDSRRHLAAARVLVCTVAALNAAGWVTVILPAYL